MRALQIAADVSQHILDAEEPPATGSIPIQAFDDSEIYAYTSVPNLRIEVGLDRLTRTLRRAPVGSLRIDLQPRTRRLVEYRVGTAVPLGRRRFKATSVVDVLSDVAETRFVAIDRVSPTPQDSSELSLAFLPIRIDAEKRELFLNLGATLFGVDWSRILDEPTSASFVDQAIGREGVILPHRLASLGTQQILPIIAHSLAASAGTIIVSEEPEISLHPEAQVAVGDVDR